MLAAQRNQVRPDWTGGGCESASPCGEPWEWPEPSERPHQCRDGATRRRHSASRTLSTSMRVLFTDRGRQRSTTVKLGIVRTPRRLQAIASETCVIVARNRPPAEGADGRATISLWGSRPLCRTRVSGQVGELLRGRERRRGLGNLDPVVVGERGESVASADEESATKVTLHRREPPLSIEEEAPAVDRVDRNEPDRGLFCCQDGTA